MIRLGLSPRSLLAALTACSFVLTFDSGAQTTSPLAKLRDLIIYSDPTFHCAFPSVVLRPDGELLCAFRRAPSRKFLYGAAHDTHTDPNSQLVLVRSHDTGESWTSPELIFAHPLGGSQDPCLVQLNDGALICTSYGWSLLPPQQTTGTKEHQFTFLGGYVLRSRDDAKTWQGPLIPPEITDGQSSDGKRRATYNRGALIQASSGELLWAAVKAGPPNSHVPTSVHLLASTDEGETWNDRSAIAADPNITFNETSLVQTRRGDLVAFIRTERPNEHAAIARSTDGGKSFSWQDLGFHAVPLQAARLQDGRILLVYGYRQKPYGVRARLLNEDASDAATAPEFIIRDDAGTWDVGYPWAVQLSDGRVLVVYYINIADGPRRIEATLLSVR